MEVQIPPGISSELANKLNENYRMQDVQAVVSGWRSAPLEHMPDEAETIEYARLGEGQGGDSERFLYIPGFTEGIVSKSTFGLDMAHRGYDIIVPDQNRHGLVRNGKGKKTRH